MRVLPARRLATSALCATLLLGVTAPAALAADVESTRDRARSAAPVPGADALVAPVKGLGDLGGVLKPVTDLLDAVLKADNGQLSADQAAELGKAVRDAIAEVKEAAPVTLPAELPADPAVPAIPPAVPVTPPAATTPTTPMAPASPADQAVPAAPAVPVLPASPPLPVAVPGLGGSLAQVNGRVAADPVGDALTALQTAVDTLLAAASSGDLAKVLPAVTAVVTGLVKVVAAVILASGLPLPTDLLPATPSTDALPAQPPIALPVR